MKITQTTLLGLLLGLLGTGAANAQKPVAKPGNNIAAIADSVLYGSETGLTNNKSVVGAAIGIYWQGKTYYYSYGLADRERKIKADTNTLYEIGSNTKVFTGLMLSSEIAAGKMSGNDYIDNYVTVNKRIRGRVRLTDIANHMSGLPTFHDSASLAELMAKDTSRDPLMLVTDDYMLSVLQRTDTLHAYGSYRYSNFGVGLLGFILQEKEKASYDQLLQSMICKPLGMRHTIATTDTSNPHLAKGYYRSERAPFINLCTAMQGAGAIKSNVADMMTFVKSQVNGNAQMQQALDISQTKYYKGEELQVAMGWHVSKMYGSELYEMRGDTYGASSLMLFDKANKLGLVLLLNSANSGVVMNIRNTILSKLLDTSGSQDRFSMPEITVDKKVLDTYAGTYELQPGFDATVTVQDDKLALQLTGQPSLKFKAVENNWFVLEKYNCQLEFTGNGQALCKEFILHQNGEHISCKRK